MIPTTLLLTPLLFGLLMLLAAHQFVKYWQQERAPRILTSALMHLCLGLLYLGAALAWPLSWRDGLRVAMIIVLLFYNCFQWRDLVRFLRQKDAWFRADERAQTVTLGTLAQPESAAEPGAKLEASRRHHRD